MNDILLNVESKEIRLARLKGGQLQDLIIDRKKTRQATGNIYRGKITNILHNIQSAFVDIGGGNGFIHISDIIENGSKLKETFEMDVELVDEMIDEKAQPQDISKLLEPNEPVLVQVVKEPIGSKGARLTANVSIAGRYLVLLPNSPHRGVSRKIESSQRRDQLKKVIQSFEMPKDMGLICRTASQYATTDMLIEEATDLFNGWNEIMIKFNESKRPTLLYEESDLIKKALITCIDKKYDRLLVDDYATFQRCKKIYDTYKEEHPLKLEFYRDKMPMFERFNVERELDKSMRNKIWLKSGGYLFLDQTEAMHTIDVNSGRSSMNLSGGDVEETLVRINLEAAQEIARQLRIRNIGGLIICDFIDMQSRKNQKRVLDYLKEQMKEDSAKCTILGMSDFGLIEMTRQRNRESLAQTIQTNCPYCAGQGLIKSHESMAIEIERALKKIILSQSQFALKLSIHPELKNHLDRGDKEYFKKLAEKSNALLEFSLDDTLHLNDFIFFSSLNGERLDA